jgi:CrcB protein
MTPEVRTFLLVGVLGGYTTFSSFSLDSVMLIERGAYMNAALYIIGSVAISIGALFAGMWIIRTV